MFLDVKLLKKAILYVLLKIKKQFHQFSNCDGANDVDMIHAEHIGIGVESYQFSEAILSSDFSISSIQFLTPLLLIHGRWCSDQCGLLIHLTIYKNTIMVFLQLFFGFYSGFSASPCFDSKFYFLHNIIFTIPQLFFICIFEQDIRHEYALLIPEIYKFSQKRGKLKLIQTLVWYDKAFFHSAIIFFFTYYNNSSFVLSHQRHTLDYPIFMSMIGWILMIVFLSSYFFN
jgi:phospholipid-transporting ATPase